MLRSHASALRSVTSSTRRFASYMYPGYSSSGHGRSNMNHVERQGKGLVRVTERINVFERWHEPPVIFVHVIYSPTVACRSIDIYRTSYEYRGPPGPFTVVDGLAVGLQPAVDNPRLNAARSSSPGWLNRNGERA